MSAKNIKIRKKLPSAFSATATLILLKVKMLARKHNSDTHLKIITIMDSEKLMHGC